jgi:hypothetical protein
MPPLRLSGEQRSQIAMVGESVALPRPLSDSRTGRRWSVLGPSAIVLTAAVLIIVQATPMVPQTPLIADNYRFVAIADSMGRDHDNRFYFRRLEEPAMEDGSRAWSLTQPQTSLETLGDGAVDGRRLMLFAEEAEAPVRQKLSELEKLQEKSRGLHREADALLGAEPRGRSDDGVQKEELAAPTATNFAAPSESLSAGFGANASDRPEVESKAAGLSKAMAGTPVDSNGNGQVVEGLGLQLQQAQDQEGLDRQELLRHRFFKQKADTDLDGVAEWDRKSLQTWQDNSRAGVQDFTELHMDIDAYGLLPLKRLDDQVSPPSGFIEITPLPESVAQDRARCEGRYSELIQKVAAPADVLRYGRFYDAGAAEAKVGQGRASLPAGYRVYVAPDWYIWARDGRTGDVMKGLSP